MMLINLLREWPEQEPIEITSADIFTYMLSLPAFDGLDEELAMIEAKEKKVTYH